MKFKIKVNFDELMTVSQFAKTKGLTAETLRYYDRIGLFEPDYIDPETSYRYYSILRYEEVGTIKQLRALGMSIEQVQEYFKDKNITKSYDMMSNLYVEFEKKVKELNVMKRELNNKLRFMKLVMNHDYTKTAYIQEHPERYVIQKGKVQPSLGGFGHDMIELENSLKQVAPVLGNEREGAFIDWKVKSIDTMNSPSTPFIFTNKLKKRMGRTISGGKYVASCYHGYYLRKDESTIKRILNYMKENGYEPEGDIIACVLIGPTTTDFTEEMLIELQVKIKDK